MFGLAASNGYKLIWPVSGASNQLLAALTHIAVTVWLNMKGKKSWFTLVPAVIMVVTTIAALIYYLFARYIPASNIVLIVTDLILLILSVGVIIQSVKKTFLSPNFRKPAQISS